MSEAATAVSLHHEGVRSRRALDLSIAGLLLALTLWHLLPAITTTPFHRDEARWIHRVYYLDEWRDPFGPRWQDEGYPSGYGSWDERYRMSGQPPLGSYAFGVGLLIQGRDLSTNGFWNMDQDDVWNRARGNWPAEADLRAARRTNVVIAAFTVVTTYALGSRLTNRVGGVAGALVLLFHPLLRDTATRAWSDPLMILLIALAAVTAARLADRPSWPRALLLGALLGLGGATKLSPLLIAPVFGALGVVLLLIARCHAPARRHVRLARVLILVPFAAYATFVAAYPYLWPDPVAQTAHLFMFRVDSFRAQALAFPQAAVDGPLDAFRRVGAELGTTFSETRWISAMLEQRVGVGPGARWQLAELDLVLAIIGGLRLLVLVVQRGLRSGPALAAAVLVGQGMIVVLTMGVEYARYLLPIVLLVAVCIGVVAGWSSTLLIRCSRSLVSFIAPLAFGLTRHVQSRSNGRVTR